MPESKQHIGTVPYKEKDRFRKMIKEGADTADFAFLLSPFTCIREYYSSRDFPYC